MKEYTTLPKPGFERTLSVYSVPSGGKLLYKYQPFYNLKLKEPGKNTGGDIGRLTLTTKEANLNIDKPIEMDIEESYDGSANIILNDGVNPLKIINPRFYLTDSNHYEVGDRKGNLDTNIYTRDNFKIEANLIKSVQTIVKLDFLGLIEGGKMPVGNYTFYFKLADADGNETDFVSESGKVVCHIGSINQPRFIRGGQLNEDSGKSVRFRLKNLDLAYNFINVYYTRTSGDGAQEILTTHKISESFKIKGIDTEINITGYEELEVVSLSDINVAYSEFESSRTVENCQNMTFAGGITNNYETFKILEKFSLLITPEVGIGNPGIKEHSIGNLSAVYEELHDKVEGYEYYNVKNIYYKLGYWDDEIYRIGIVYVLNDYTLSPVFNIRGVKELSEGYKFTNFHINDPINHDQDYIIEKSNGLENSKGVFKINSEDSVFSMGNSTRPLGLRFNFTSDVIDGDRTTEGLSDITKGFFFVRQRRIPTILAQSVGISTTKKGNLPIVKTNSGYEIESFLKKDSEGRPILQSSKVILSDSEVFNNALLCPEANLRTEIYNSYFNSSEYVLRESKHQATVLNPSFSALGGKEEHYFLGGLATKQKSSFTPSKIKTSLLLIEPGIELIKNNDSKFASQAGDAVVAHKNIDVKYGDYSDPTTRIKDLNAYNNSNTKIRGIFNSYIGSDYNGLKPNTYYNIHQKDYDFEDWRNYFKMRYSDSSPYSPISDRMEYEELDRETTIVETGQTGLIFRGDCYINTFTHKVNWNFIDPELPTNTKIIDRYSWYKNYRVSNKASEVVKNNEGDFDTMSYNKLLPLFTYKRMFVKTFEGEEEDALITSGIIDSENKGFKKYSDRNGTFGFDKLNRPDINAVGLGKWVTYKICSNVNLAMRDVNLTYPSEEAMHGMKRSFYPLQSIEKDLKLPEANIINKGISKTTGNKYYFEVPDVPFIKTNFSTRINYSNILQQTSFVNGSRTFLSKNYQDYTSEHGAIVKLVEWYGTLLAIMEHGVLQIPVNERAMMKNESGENVYINTDIVLPKNPKVLSNMFGSIWPDSVIKTSRFVYGLDTVGKKIWRTNGEVFTIISDLTIQKFLNDNIKLRESDQDLTIGFSSIKTHYNAFKGDIMFTFKYGEVVWNICWNELLEKWVTRYSWYPEFSENINNIFYTFANKDVYNTEGKNKVGILYKHGISGTLAEEGKIEPTKWYDKQEPFEFEFVVAPNAGAHKIYNNFEIISNKVEPNSFIYSILGDGLSWNDEKNTIIALNEGNEELTK